MELTSPPRPSEKRKLKSKICVKETLTLTARGRNLGRTVDSRSPSRRPMWQGFVIVDTLLTPLFLEPLSRLPGAFRDRESSPSHQVLKLSTMLAFCEELLNLPSFPVVGDLRINATPPAVRKAIGGGETLEAGGMKDWMYS